MTSRLLVLALVLSSAAGVRAASTQDCHQYNHGEGILTNITVRYYQNYVPKSPEDNAGLQASVLYWMKADANAAAKIAVARFKGGEDCEPMRAAVNKLSADYTAEIAKIDAAWAPCTTQPKAAEETGKCYQAAGTALKTDAQIRKQGGSLDAFLRAYEAHPDCEALNTDESDQGSELDLYNRLLKQPCERDARCAQIRIGKTREARGYLGKVQDGALQAPIAAAKSLIIAGEGGSCNPPSDDAGAEHILWCLRDHPEQDNIKLFLATSKVATASVLLQGVNCPE